LSWSENMASVQNADRAFSPLDEELELLPGKLTPHAHECLIRFGTIMPFAKAAKELEFVLKVGVSEPTARRYVEAAGKAYEEYQTVEVERLENTCPPAKENLQKMFLSVDGAMVPLVGGEWAEVKTLTIGEIQKPVLERGEWVVHSKNHSYFSRMTESSLFRRLALVETHARSIEKAKIVAAVTDGAEWEQGFLDFHCPQAVRILDFPHAAGRVSQIGQAVWGEESEQTKKWLADQLHQLKHDGPSVLFSEVMGLRNQKPALEVLQKNQAYLEKRSDHMQYPRYQAQHLPIGSGAMESGNKVVVEARLKGAGMHWAIPHVNPMLTLRNIFCSERWQEGWQQITITLRQQERQRRKELHQKHNHDAQQRLPQPPIKSQVLEIILPQPVSAPSVPSEPNLPQHKSSIPAPNHPWRRSPIGKAKFLPSNQFSKN
jgi:hypothetical protein